MMPRHICKHCAPKPTYQPRGRILEIQETNTQDTRTPFQINLDYAGHHAVGKGDTKEEATKLGMEQLLKKVGDEMEWKGRSEHWERAAIRMTLRVVNDILNKVETFEEHISTFDAVGYVTETTEFLQEFGIKVDEKNHQGISERMYSIIVMWEGFEPYIATEYGPLDEYSTVTMRALVSVLRMTRLRMQNKLGEMMENREDDPWAIE